MTLLGMGTFYRVSRINYLENHPVDDVYRQCLFPRVHPPRSEFNMSYSSPAKTFPVFPNEYFRLFQTGSWKPLLSLPITHFFRDSQLCNHAPRPALLHPSRATLDGQFLHIPPAQIQAWSHRGQDSGHIRGGEVGIVPLQHPGIRVPREGSHHGQGHPG
jgi:hypothetical protein